MPPRNSSAVAVATHKANRIQTVVFSFNFNMICDWFGVRVVCLRVVCLGVVCLRVVCCDWVV